MNIILAFLAACLGKAIRDTIAFHFKRSFLNRWFKENSRIWKWFRSDWKDKPKKPPLSWSLFAPLHDGWHMGDFLSYSLLGLALYNCGNIKDILLSFATFFITFELLYKYVYVKRNDRRNI